MTTQCLADGLCFGEGPRWRDDALWLSDMHAHQVIKVTGDGNVSEIVDVPTGHRVWAGCRVASC